MKSSGVASTERFWGLLLSAPYIAGLLVFAVGPILFSWVIGFFAWDSLTPPRFVGFGNWTRLFGDPLFWKALGNTLYFVIGTVPIGIALSMLLAMLANRPLRGIGFFRTLYFTPVVTSTVAVALVWAWFYDPNYGVLNYAIASAFKLAGLKPPSPIPWLADPATAMPAIMLMSVWKGLGYNMVILLAALQGVPRHLYEAAEIDGAGPLMRFRHITIPGVSPVLFFVVTVGVISAFQVFDQVYIMTREGRPADSTLTIVYYLYRHAFSNLELGYASTVGTALFAIIFAATLVQLQLRRHWVHT